MVTSMIVRIIVMTCKISSTPFHTSVPQVNVYVWRYDKDQQCQQASWWPQQLTLMSVTVDPTLCKYRLIKGEKHVGTDGSKSVKTT